jgi:hypothetical protein
MSNVDKQRISAVHILEGLGYRFAAGTWQAPGDAASSLLFCADGMLSCLMQRADELTNCAKGSDEKRELERITNAIEAYEALRWPEGTIPGGKGSIRD